MMKAKIIVIGSILVILTAFYLWSINNAYNKGYNQHALEVAQVATEVVMGSNNDILVAAQVVKDKEKEIKDDEVCSAVWDFDLRKCLHK